MKIYTTQEVDTFIELSEWKNYAVGDTLRQTFEMISYLNNQLKQCDGIIEKHEKYYRDTIDLRRQLAEAQAVMESEARACEMAAQHLKKSMEPKL